MAPFSTDEYLTAWTRLTTLYVEGRLPEALELACAMEERFPDRRFYIGSARASLHALLDDADAAIRVAREVVESGGWWSERHIADPDLDPVRHHPEFQMLVQAMARLRTRSMDDAAGGPKTTVLTADGSAPTAVVIALHMHGMSAAETVAHWKSATSWGVAVAVPESTQRDADGNRCWDDDELTERDVLLARDHASPAPGAAGGPPVVLAGASQGAGQA